MICAETMILQFLSGGFEVLFTKLKKFLSNLLLLYVLRGRNGVDNFE